MEQASQIWRMRASQMEDEGIAVEDDSDTCTVSSSCFKWVPENDREYARLGQFLYGLPIDEMEQERVGYTICKVLAHTR
jgi:hypothetical protein